MQENKKDVSDPSQVSGSSQVDPPTVSLLSSKVQNKLQKLARWRIDPSSIEFPADSREFRGGFATVSRGLLVSSARAAGENESELITNEHPSSDSNPHSDCDPQQPEDDQQGRDEKAVSLTAGSENDRREERGKNPNNDEEPRSYRPTLIPKGGGESTRDSALGSGDGDPWAESDILKPEANYRSEGEQSDRREADFDNPQTTEGAENEGEKPKEEPNSDHQTFETRQVVAVKKLKIGGDTDLERVLKLALREIDILVELSHPNIVKLEGFVEDLSARKVWLVFLWEEHGNLRDFLASGEWEVPERISLINDVTLGLEYLHSRDSPIYHGDLKSLNILVDSECRALITDFGSALHRENDTVGMQRVRKDAKPQLATHPTTGGEHITLEASFGATDNTLTLAGSSYTLRWAAPELLQDDEPCLRSDIWAFGWIAYEVMTNTIPFHDIKKEAIIINRVIQGHMPPVTEHARMSLIRALCSLMVQCWSINPEERPTAEECSNLISWMPMIVPAPNQSMDEAASQLRHARLLKKLGQMYRRQADYTSAVSSFTQALEIYTNHNDQKGRGETLGHLAGVHLFRHEYTEAVAFYSEALQVVTELNDERERAHAIFGLAKTHHLRREYSEAAAFYSECLEIYTKTGSKRQRAIGLSGLADLHHMMGQYTEAIRLYSEALPILTDVGDQRERAIALWGLAEVHTSQGIYDQAVDLYSEALQIYTDIGDHAERARTLWSLAEIHRLRNGYSEASKLYTDSLQIATKIDDRRGRGTALWGLGAVHQAQCEYDEAIKLYSEAKQLFIAIGDNTCRSEALMSLAETNQMQGHSSEAISFYTEASEVLEELGDSLGASLALESAGKIRKTLQEATATSTETVEQGEESQLSSL